MDIRYFLEQRLAFVKQLYLNGASPFEDRKWKIENEEAPFIPPYSEDAEPAYLNEWLEADSSVQVLGSACLSMIAASLHLYFKEWERRLGPAPGPSLKAEFKSGGWPNGYKAFYLAHSSDRFEDGPFDFALIEELVLARNSIQHPDSLVFETSRYSDDALQKMLNPFFVSDREKSLIEEADGESRQWLYRPHIHITTEKFLHAVSQVFEFVKWLEDQGENILHKRHLERKRQREMDAGFKSF
ncbi:hypothetical protein [Pseudomonas poae]|uniref:hypothetical protein n=1 Tax=Pseudomonas poae TaxID=200451 RepID=UPI0016494171|nr:hypothetical protein [Pseudomonas poae]MBC3199599.1 hypothetical protein [Pseudomonas poae]